VRRLAAWGLLVWGGLAIPAYAQNTTTRVSVATGGAEGSKGSSAPALSADGRFVVFESNATTLVANDTNSLSDIFLHDRLAVTTERVNLGPGNIQATGGNSFAPSVSADGRYVAFSSKATNLVASDTNAHEDVFVHDRQTSTTTRVSVSSAGAQATDGSIGALISADGRYVAFASAAANLVADDTNGRVDIFRRDLLTATTVRVNLSNGTPAGGNAQATGNDSFVGSISADGRLVAFYTGAPNLVLGDSNVKSDVFVRDLQTFATRRVSVGSGGVQGNNHSQSAHLSTDGRFVVFTSLATNFVGGGGPGIYVHDRSNGTTSAISITPAGSFVFPDRGRISGDGRFICFDGQLDQNPQHRVFVIDRQTLTRNAVSVSTSGAAANQDSFSCAISSTGTVVAFSSAADNLVEQDTNGESDVFVRTELPVMALDKTELTFAATTSGATFVTQTAAQTVRLTQSGPGVATWTASASQPWLQVSPASGSGSADLSISVTPTSGLPASGTVTATIFVSLAGAGNTLPPIAVRLTLIANGTSVGPFGTVDTPADNRTGVTGAVPFTGWALDDIEVTKVSICRAAFGSEIAPIDPNCGGAAEIFVGFSVFIDGARPDVAATFPTHPLSTRAGWGFMVLTNLLPNQGNGTYIFTMRAFDREGHVALLGTRTMTCDNANATLPFGTIDTPFQGGLVSGISYVNFGWALTPLPKTIPFDGSTIHVLVDGVDIGTADYNHLRTDIQALFPGLNNTNGAIGFRILDTTALANGLHTISWTVADDQGAIAGIGSRFFTVSNGTAAVTSATSSARAAADAEASPLDTTPLAGRRGWDLAAPYGLFAADSTGVTVIRSEEVSRVELHLGDGDYAGHLRTHNGLEPLPIGSRLDQATNTFTWAPGPGFVGTYDFVFVRSLNGRAIARRDVRIILHPKGRGSVGPQVVIDTPRSRAAVHQPFMIGGWAADLDAPNGTGVTTIHAWAYPISGGAPRFLGATVYGGARPDVAAVHGRQFIDSGFGLIVRDLPPGDYDLALFAWSTEKGGFVAPTITRVTVRP
jgi:Tol biopolymer transport system component